jgi:hypothetical protein
MSAFSWGTVNQITQSIRQLYYRRRQVGRMELTHEEFLQLFVPATNRELFRMAAPAADFTSNVWSRFVIESPVHGTITTSIWLRDVEDSFAPPRPRNPTIQPDAPEGLRAKFDSWIANGADSSRDFGRVQKVFQMLNEHCSKQTMRYYWPSIIAILSEDDNTKGFAAELQQLKTPANPKPLPAGLLQACRKTAETISIVQLIDKNFQRSGMAPPIMMEVVAGQMYDEPIGKFHGLT